MGRATGKGNPNLGALQLLRGLFGTIGSAGRGAVAGTLGLPGDLESLGRLVVGGENLLPTSDRMREVLPQLPEAYRQPVMEELGTYAAADPRAAIKLTRSGLGAVKNAVTRAGQDFARASAAANPAVVKRKGGVWSDRGAEQLVSEALDNTNVGEWRPERIAELKRRFPDQQIADNREQIALGKFMEGPFTTYLKRDFASPSDPIRKLYDQGIYHKDFNDQWIPESSSFLPTTRMATTEHGKMWEDMADATVSGRPAKDLGHYGDWEDFVPYTDLDEGIVIKYNPTTGEVLPTYLNNVPGDEIVYRMVGAPEYNVTDLGVDHIVDTLMNSLQSGKLTPEQVMSKNFSVEAAIRHVHEANREAEKAAAKAVRARMSELQPLAEYPSGHKWYELPDTSDETAMKLANQLGCEGGWCTREEWAAQNYGSGDKRLRVLVDPEGRAVSQITVQAPRDAYKPTLDDMFAGSTRFENKVRNDMMLKEAGNPEWVNGMPSDQQVIDYALKNFPDDRAVKDFLSLDTGPKKAAITEIKGRFNKTPTPEQQEMIRDIIKRGDFGDISELENAGLIDMSAFSGNYIPGYMTADEAIAAVNDLQKQRPDVDYGNWLSELEEFRRVSRGEVDPWRGRF